MSFMLVLSSSAFKKAVVVAVIHYLQYNSFTKMPNQLQLNQLSFLYFHTYNADLVVIPSVTGSLKHVEVI